MRGQSGSDWLKATLPEIRIELRSIPFFSDVLPPEQLDDLATACSPRAFRSGAVLMRQGEDAASMLCLIEGVVRVVIEAGARKPSEIIRLRAGTVVGEMELLSGGPRLATVSALEDVRALEISRATLKRMLAASPDLAESFSATLTRRDAIYARAITRGPTVLQWLLARLKRGRRKAG